MPGNNDSAFFVLPDADETARNVFSGMPSFFAEIIDEKMCRICKFFV